MEVSFSKELIRDLKKIKQKQPQLFKKIQKQLKFFKKDAKYPSLRTHKLKGNLSNEWSISIEGNIRLIYYVQDNLAVFFKIGTHDEVYRK